jgi:anthranilate phosphoribosyltransferase
MQDKVKNILKQVTSGETLSLTQARECFTAIMEGQWEDSQIASLLTALAMRGETHKEILGAAMTLRDKVAAIKAPEGAVDCCGTGGDGASTLNISTAVAFVLAAAEIPVAKHGNRAASSKSGAADVLEKLGIPLSGDKKLLQAALEATNYCFLMAPHHHSATKYVVPVRKAMGIRTLFNLIGPLSNPAGVENQLIGVYDKKWLYPMAHALREMGTKRAWIVHGRDGLDEITVTDKTDCVILKEDGEIEELVIDPQELGLPHWTLEDIKGGDIEYNTKKLQEVLDGKYKQIGVNAYFDIICLNVAAVFVMMEKCIDLKSGLNLAALMLGSGKAKDVMEHYKSFMKQAG